MVLSRISDNFTFPGFACTQPSREDFYTPGCTIAADRGYDRDGHRMDALDNVRRCRFSNLLESGQFGPKLRIVEVRKFIAKRSRNLKKSTTKFHFQRF